MRIIHFADAHIGVETHSRPVTSAEITALPESFAPGVNRTATYTGMPSRLVDSLRAFDELVAFALTEPRADLIVFSGDAYRSRDPSQTHQREFARCINRLAAEGIPVFLLTGNHDVPNTEGRATALDIFDALAVVNVTVASRPGVHLIGTKAGPVQIVAVPWLRRSSAAAREELHGKSAAEINEWMQSFLTNEISRMAGELDPDIPSILSAHATATTATVGHERTMMMGNDYLLLPSAFQAHPIDYAALGHIHRHQRVADGPPVVYSGSLHRVDFSEEDDAKGFCVVNIDPALPPGRRVARWFFQPVWSRPFKTIQVRLRDGEQDVMGAIIDRLAKADARDAVVRVDIQCPPELKGVIDHVRIRNYLLREGGAHVVAGVSVQVDSPDRSRIRLEAGVAIESLQPEQALEMYLESKDVDRKRRAALIKAAREIIRGGESVEGGVAVAGYASDVNVRIAEAEDMAGVHALRHEVFIDEQSVDPEEEWDGRDDEAIHAVALLDEEIVGTGRLLTDEDGDICRIGRMAVRENLRRHRIGDKILALLEEAARERGFRQALLHAQTYVKDFYAQAGYLEQGDVFMEAEIEHIAMTKDLA